MPESTSLLAGVFLKAWKCAQLATGPKTNFDLHHQTQIRLWPDGAEILAADGFGTIIRCRVFNNPEPPQGPPYFDRVVADIERNASWVLTQAVNEGVGEVELTPVEVAPTTQTLWSPAVSRGVQLRPSRGGKIVTVLVDQESPDINCSPFDLPRWPAEPISMIEDAGILKIRAKLAGLVGDLLVDPARTPSGGVALRMAPMEFPGFELLAVTSTIATA